MRNVLIGAMAVLLMPASAQVISLDEGGTSRLLCTAGQNAHTTPTSVARIPSVYRAPLERAGHLYNISTDLLDALARQESGYNARARSAKGAIGIMQLMPATAKALGVDPWDPEQNIVGGAAYLRYMLDVYDGHIDLALSAYNAGQEAVQRYGGIPPFKETRQYLTRNFERLALKSDLQSLATARNETGYIQSCRR